MHFIHPGDASIRKGFRVFAVKVRRTLPKLRWFEVVLLTELKSL
jgi:hypothetical protein